MIQKAILQVADSEIVSFSKSSSLLKEGGTVFVTFWILKDSQNKKIVNTHCVFFEYMNSKLAPNVGHEILLQLFVFYAPYVYLFPVHIPIHFELI